MTGDEADAEVGADGEELLRLASADNLRDVAGPDTPYLTRDGVPLRRGVLYRANALQISEDDAARLEALGITAVYDLRSALEVEEHPDVAIPGSTWTHLEVTGIPVDAIAGLTRTEDAVAVMHEVYRAFVEQPGARAAFGRLLSAVADEAPRGGASLFHCTAGKDRTGWASVLLLHVAGVDDEVIREDYLLTNERSAGTRTRYLGLVAEHLGEDAVEVYEAVMAADLAYLDTAHATVAREYGDLDRYLRDGLDLGPDVVRRLRERLVDAPSGGPVSDPSDG